jgi:hypothetical protein
MKLLTFIVLLPFVVELVADLILINRGKKDLSATVRLVMFLLVSIDYSGSTWNDINLQTSYLLWALAPYCFFDNALSIARWRSFSKWDKLGETKDYDKFLKSLRLKPWVLLILRVISFIGILLLANML